MDNLFDGYQHSQIQREFNPNVDLKELMKDLYISLSSFSYSTYQSFEHGLVYEIRESFVRSKVITKISKAGCGVIVTCDIYHKPQRGPLIFWSLIGLFTLVVTVITPLLNA